MSEQVTKFNQVDAITGSATSTAGAATINAQTGVITTESLTTAAGATYTMTLTNSYIQASSIVTPVAGRGTNTSCGLVPITVTPAAGSCVMIFQNPGLTALSGTMKIAFTVFNLL